MVNILLRLFLALDSLVGGALPPLVDPWKSLIYQWISLIQSGGYPPKQCRRVKLSWSLIILRAGFNLTYWPCRPMSLQDFPREKSRKFPFRSRPILFVQALRHVFFMALNLMGLICRFGTGFAFPPSLPVFDSDLMAYAQIRSCFDRHGFKYALCG